MRSGLKQHLPVKRELEQNAETLKTQLSGPSAGRLQETMAEVEGAWLQLEQAVPERKKGEY